MQAGDSDDDASLCEVEEELIIERISFADEGLREFPFQVLSRAGVECSGIGARLVVDLSDNFFT